MRRSTRRTSKHVILSPEHKERMGVEVSNQSAPNVINVEGTAGVAASGGAMAAASGAMVESACSAMSMDNNTMVSSLGSPVAESKRSKESNESEEDYSSSDDEKMKEWDEGEEEVDLEQESYGYTGTTHWAVHGNVG